MNRRVDESVILGVNQGKESSFRILYDSYYTYLCSCAVSYIFDSEKAREIVNDVFVNVWGRRESLEYPALPYLIRSVKYGCLNHIRTLKSQQTFLDRYKEEIFSFQEEYCLMDKDPLDLLEIQEIEKRVKKSIESLPEKCRIIFDKYLYEGFSPKEIAEQLQINVNTVRVQIKIAMDKIKFELGPLAMLLFFFIMKK